MSARQLRNPQAQIQQAGPEQHIRNQLEYLADLVLELKTMADRTNTPTLSGLLDLAHREAQIRLRQLEQP